jgi:hypothetical protein
MVLHAYSFSTQEAEAGGLWVQNQPKMHSKFKNLKNQW